VAAEGVTPEWWWAPALSAAVGSTIAVVGWISVYLLGLRAQRRQFRRQLVNTARVELKSALDEAAAGLRRVLTAAVRASATVQQALDDRHTNAGPAVGSFLSEAANWKPTEVWARLLEEYEAFFPGSLRLREDLRSRYRDSVGQLRELERHINYRLQVVSAAGASTAYDLARGLVPGFRSGIVSLTVPSTTLTHLEALRVFVLTRSLEEVAGASAMPRYEPRPGWAEVVKLRKGELTFGTFPGGVDAADRSCCAA
jgi:hypothetical protein